MTAIEQIKALLGKGNYLDQPSDMEPYLTSWRGGYKGASPLVAFPKTTAQVSEIVQICAATKTPIVPQSGNTGLVGGSVPSSKGDAVVLSLSRMKQVRNLDAPNFAITVESGLILSELQDIAENNGFLFPLSMSSEGSAEVGGCVSTNAGGTAVLRYGTTRELVLGLEVVLPNGEIWKALSALRKNNTGYDLKQLFIGAEGTLGIITAITFKLFPKPTQTETAWVALKNVADAIALFSELKFACGDSLTAFEIISEAALSLVLTHIPNTRDPFTAKHPYYVLIECGSSAKDIPLRSMLETALTKALENHIAQDVLIAENLSQSNSFWHMREHISEAAKKAGLGVHFDISVPISAIADFIQTTDVKIHAAIPQAIILPFGHIGDGNIHYNICLPKTTSAADFSHHKQQMKTIVYSELKRLSGSISAEHGIGVERLEDLATFKSSVELELMKTIKRALDPDNLMNPGKMLKL